MLTRPVNPRNHGFVSISMRLSSSSSAPELPPCCLAASSNPTVIDENNWNLKYDIGWNTNWIGRVGVVVLISTYCERKFQNSLGKMIGL